jgi:hypothetical protein
MEYIFGYTVLYLASHEAALITDPAPEVDGTFSVGK